MSVQAFDIAAFLVASARDSLEAPPVYGALRMIDAAARLADLDPDDDHLRDLGRRFADLRTLIMDDQDAFAARLDDLLAEIAAEALRRNRAARPPTPRQGTEGDDHAAR